MGKDEVINWPRIGCGCILLSPKHPGKALYGLRKGSHGAGKWALPGGKLDLDEDALELCIQREIEEEVGIELRLEDIEFVAYSNDPRLDGDIHKHFVTCLFKAIIPDDAVVQNLEPHKCEGWEWTSYEQLLEYEREDRLFVPMSHLLETNRVDKTFWAKDVAWKGSPVRDAYEWCLTNLVYSPVVVAVLLSLVEVLLCSVVIWKVPYTEIDWKAYMQEVEGYLSGERNYELIRGDTGPLVYPAGFLYIFSALHWLTDSGSNIALGQWIFAGLYLANLGVVFSIYHSVWNSAEERKAKVPFWKRLCRYDDDVASGVPPWAWVALILSKRVHSLFVLRMFNDCVAVFLGMLAILSFTRGGYRAGCLVYSFAVAVKMNMLLWAPGVLLVLLLGNGIVETVVCLGLCAAVQVLLGLPFLTTYPWQYLHKAFELGRVFKYEWTVNFRFLSEQAFTSSSLSLALLVCTALAFVLFAHKWVSAQGSILRRFQKGGGSAAPALIRWDAGRELRTPFIVVTIFTSNFIGVAFARTLHYQFYGWYFHSLPLLLWHSRLGNAAGSGIGAAIKLGMMAAIEICFNVFPSTAASSVVLQACHVLLLAALFIAPAPAAFVSKPGSEVQSEPEGVKKGKRRKSKNA